MLCFGTQCSSLEVSHGLDKACDKQYFTEYGLHMTYYEIRHYVRLNYVVSFFVDLVIDVALYRMVFIETPTDSLPHYSRSEIYFKKQQQ